MNTIFSRSLILAWCLSLSCGYIIAAIEEDSTNSTVTDRLIRSEAGIDLSKQLVRISYTDKPVAEAVNEVGAQLGINIIMPQDGKGLDKAFYE